MVSTNTNVSTTREALDVVTQQELVDLCELLDMAERMSARICRRISEGGAKLEYGPICIRCTPPENGRYEVLSHAHGCNDGFLEIDSTEDMIEARDAVPAYHKVYVHQRDKAGRVTTDIAKGAAVAKRKRGKAA